MVWGLIVEAVGRVGGSGTGEDVISRRRKRCGGCGSFCCWVVVVVVVAVVADADSLLFCDSSTGLLGVAPLL